MIPPSSSTGAAKTWSYDPWGQVLTGGAGARPVQGYVASIGHRQDDVK